MWFGWHSKVRRININKHRVLPYCPLRLIRHSTCALWLTASDTALVFSVERKSQKTSELVLKSESSLAFRKLPTLHIFEIVFEIQNYLKCWTFSIIHATHVHRLLFARLSLSYIFAFSKFAQLYTILYLKKVFNVDLRFEYDFSLTLLHNPSGSRVALGGRWSKWSERSFNFLIICVCLCAHVAIGARRSWKLKTR